MRVRRIIALLSGSILLVGCGSEQLRSPAAEPAAVVAPASPAAVGAKQTLADQSTSIDVTLHDVVPGTSGAKVGGRTVPVTSRLVSIDVEVCLHGFDGTVRASRWQLVDSANGRYEPEVSPAQGLAPEYPYAPEGTLDGECVRGWISFLTEKDPVVTVRYATETGHTLRWDIN